ncbi:YncE family protein [Candidatus Nomurabacteria bacterium]|nr:YncE family protein [Candidatus Nomurabacteria bacterium]
MSNKLNMAIKRFKYAVPALLLVFSISLALVPSSANAATTISITSPTSGSSTTSSAFTVTGTASPVRNITVKVNGTTVGVTTSDGSGNWSVNVTGQSAGTKTIEATASYQQLYVNSMNAGSLTDSVMTKINPINNQPEGTFSLFSNGTPLFWVPNGDFTKAYGAAGPLGSPYVYTIDLTNGIVSSFLMAGTSPNPNVPAYNQDYSKVYIPDSDNSNDIVHVYNTSTNAEIGSGIAVGNCANTAAYRPTTDEVWVANACDDTISVINSLSDTVTDTHTLLGSGTCLYFTPDGSKLYAAQCGGTVIYEIDPATGTTVDTINMPSGAVGYSLRMNSIGSKLYIPNITSNQLDVLDTATNAISQIAPVGSGPIGVTISPDDTKAYVTNADGAGGFSGSSISVINLDTNSVTESISVAVAPSVGWFAPLDSSTTTVNFTLSSSSLANTGQNTNRVEILAATLLSSGFAIVVYTINKQRSISNVSAKK